MLAIMTTTKFGCRLVNSYLCNLTGNNLQQAAAALFAGETKEMAQIQACSRVSRYYRRHRHLLLKLRTRSVIRVASSIYYCKLRANYQDMILNSFLSDFKHKPINDIYIFK